MDLKSFHRYIANVIKGDMTMTRADVVHDRREFDLFNKNKLEHSIINLIIFHNR